jgi:hypothetical protein
LLQPSRRAAERSAFVLDSGLSQMNAESCCDPGEGAP